MPAAKAACVGFRNQLWIAYGLMFFGAAIYWFLLCASLGPLLVYCPKFGGRLRGKFGKLAGSCEVRVRRQRLAVRRSVREPRSYFPGCTGTVQVLWYSKKLPKAACVFTASSCRVCVPTESGGCTMPIPWNQMIELTGGKPVIGMGGLKKNWE